MNRFLWSALLLLPLAFVGCATTTMSSSDAASVRAGVGEGVAAWTSAVNRGDMQAVAALYTEDAVLLPPNHPLVRGRADIGAFFGGLAALAPRDVVLTSDEIEGCGDTAYEVGRYQMSLQPPGASRMTDRGKYIVIWKRQPDGSWKIARDSFNSDLPPPGSHSH